jgi:hypothetical protein
MVEEVAEVRVEAKEETDVKEEVSREVEESV